MKHPFLKSLGLTTHRYTKGFEYSLGVTNYIGYYHLNGKTPYTGEIHTGTSEKLEPYNSKNVLIYNQLKPNNKKIDTFTHPYTMPITPTEAQYAAGRFTRYFMVKQNGINNIIYEVNDSMASSYGEPDGIDNNLYKLTKMPWEITKNQKLKPQIITANAANLRIANRELPGLNAVISSLYEYSFEVI